MTFSEKISKILNTNKLGIDSASAMERYVKAGQSAISAHTSENAPKDSAPGLATQKKIIEKLRISQEWWDSGEGQIYLSKSGVIDETNQKSEKAEPHERALSLAEKALDALRGELAVRKEMRDGDISRLERDKDRLHETIRELTAAINRMPLKQ